MSIVAVAIRRWGAVLLMSVLALSVGLAACSGPKQQNLQGKIAWPKDGDLWIFDLPTRQQTKITNLPQGAAVTGATWSPDGKRIMYAQFWRRPNERSSGADLMVANADGSNPQLFAERDAANTVLETPLWAPSGRVYYTVRHVDNGRETQQVVRQTEGGQPEVLVDNGYSAAITPDESTFVYLRNTRIGQSMMRKTVGESGDGCEVLSDQIFQYLSLPRISPDGKRIALGGSGEPNVQQASGCGGDPRSTAAAGPPPTVLGSTSGDLLTLLSPALASLVPAASTASAASLHGLPADVYTLNLDGSNMTRIADIKDDDPTVAFAPDGSKLAIFGVAALFIVDSKGSTPDRLVDQGGYGGLDWTK